MILFAQASVGQHFGLAQLGSSSAGLTGVTNVAAVIWWIDWNWSREPQLDIQFVFYKVSF